MRAPAVLGSKPGWSGKRSAPRNPGFFRPSSDGQSRAWPCFYAGRSIPIQRRLFATHTRRSRPEIRPERRPARAVIKRAGGADRGLVVKVHEAVVVHVAVDPAIGGGNRVTAAVPFEAQGADLGVVQEIHVPVEVD